MRKPSWIPRDKTEVIIALIFIGLPTIGFILLLLK